MYSCIIGEYRLYVPSLGWALESSVALAISDASVTVTVVGESECCIRTLIRALLI